MINKVLRERANNVKSYLTFQALDWAQDTIPRLFKHYCTSTLTLDADTDDELDHLCAFLEIVDGLPQTRRFGSLTVNSGNMKSQRISDAGGFVSRVFKFNDRWYFGYPVTKWSAFRRTYNTFSFKLSDGDSSMSPASLSRAENALSSYVIVTIKTPDAFTDLLVETQELCARKEREKAERAAVMKEKTGKKNGQMITAAERGPDGSWKGKKIYARDVSSVTMSPETYKRVFTDTLKWIGKRDLYLSSGIPHKRVILLYGPPGMGKTSLGRALATETDYTLCIGDLTDTTTKDELEHMVRSAGSGSIVLFDDFDTIKAFRRDYVPTATSHAVDETFGGKLSGASTRQPLRLRDILNIFDGAIGLDSQIIMLTTNDISGIDEAFLRKGRVDVIVHVDYFTHDEVCTYVKQRFPDAVIPENKRFGVISGCDLQNIFLSDDNDEDANRFIEAIPTEGSPESIARIRAYKEGRSFVKELEEIPVIQDGSTLDDVLSQTQSLLPEGAELCTPDNHPNR